METKQPYGWDEAGNCLWCGEAGRCQCDHSRQVEASARRMRSHVDLLAACKLAAEAFVSHLDYDCDENSAEREAYLALQAAIAKAEGQDGGA